MRGSYRGRRRRSGQPGCASAAPTEAQLQLRGYSRSKGQLLLVHSQWRMMSMSGQKLALRGYVCGSGCMQLPAWAPASKGGALSVDVLLRGVSCEGRVALWEFSSASACVQ